MNCIDDRAGSSSSSGNSDGRGPVFPAQRSQGQIPNIGSRMSASRESNRPKYVYELPYFERREVCSVLDESNQWESLGGGLMCYTPTELSEFRRALYRGGSPTDALLTAWGNQNHTILELFTLLGKLGHFRGMKIIQNFVDPKYHVYIKDHDLGVTCDLIQLDLQGAAKSKRVLDNVPQKAEDKNDNLVVVEAKLNNNENVDESVGCLPKIPYADLQLATDNWERRNIIGKGGFGTVYRGMWKNTPVAIKRMEQRANQAFIQSQLRQSLGELRFLNSYRHDNILPLYGFCLEGEHPCLVYQYMTNGSLEDRLLCRNRSYPLNWKCRYDIARSVACGIQFLHSIGPTPLIHGDIKSANILLDKNFEAKVGDFGLAREMNDPNVGASYIKVSRVHGTRPYLPDEYLRSKKLSTKVDTFSFGIMLYEIIAGQRAYDESRAKKFLRDTFEETDKIETLKDPKGGSENPDIFWILLRLAKSCTQRLARDRPEMVQVLKSVDELMSQASIRTLNSHMTGLPLLFEQTQSLRPGSLLPSGHSANPRLSPIDVRTNSPQLLPPQSSTNHIQNPVPRPVVDSSGIPISQRVSRVTQNMSPVPAVQMDGSTKSSSSNESSDNRNINTQGFVPHLDTAGRPHLHINDTAHAQVPRVAVTPMPLDLPDDQFLPVFLEPSFGDMSEDEAMTVIPLITELGIKD